MNQGPNGRILGTLPILTVAHLRQRVAYEFRTQSLFGHWSLPTTNTVDVQYQLRTPKFYPCTYTYEFTIVSLGGSPPFAHT